MARAKARAPARPSPAVQRAVRAAAEPEPWLPPEFVMWVVGRVIAFGLMLAAAWGVYWVASSPRFDVQSISIHGNTLLSREEIESAAAIQGVNIFWLDRAQVAERLRTLPLVQRVDVGATLPDTVDIQVVERQPVGFWTSGDQTYLVDREGVILKAVDGETAQTRACAGQLCDPRLATLPSVAQAEGQSPMPGDRVDANALSTSARLASLLPRVGIQPVSFQWSTANGIEVPTRDGWSARFDESGNLDQQVATLRTIRDQLSRTRVNAQLIDVRFGDRPYFR